MHNNHRQFQSHQQQQAQQFQQQQQQQQAAAAAAQQYLAAHQFQPQPSPQPQLQLHTGMVGVNTVPRSSSSSPYNYFARPAAPPSPQVYSPLGTPIGHQQQYPPQVLPSRNSFYLPNNTYEEQHYFKQQQQQHHPRSKSIVSISSTTSNTPSTGGVQKSMPDRYHRRKSMNSMTSLNTLAQNSTVSATNATTTASSSTSTTASSSSNTTNSNASSISSTSANTVNSNASAASAITTPASTPSPTIQQAYTVSAPPVVVPPSVVAPAPQAMHISLPPPTPSPPAVVATQSVAYPSNPTPPSSSSSNRQSLYKQSSSSSTATLSNVDQRPQQQQLQQPQLPTFYQQQLAQSQRAQMHHSISTPTLHKMNNDGVNNRYHNHPSSSSSSASQHYQKHQSNKALAATPPPLVLPSDVRRHSLASSSSLSRSSNSSPSPTATPKSEHARSSSATSLPEPKTILKNSKSQQLHSSSGITPQQASVPSSSSSSRLHNQQKKKPGLTPIQPALKNGSAQQLTPQQLKRLSNSAPAPPPVMAPANYTIQGRSQSMVNVKAPPIPQSPAPPIPQIGRPSSRASSNSISSTATAPASAYRPQNARTVTHKPSNLSISTTLEEQKSSKFGKFKKVFTFSKKDKQSSSTSSSKRQPSYFDNIPESAASDQGSIVSMPAIFSGRKINGPGSIRSAYTSGKVETESIASTKSTASSISFATLKRMSRTFFKRDNSAADALKQEEEARKNAPKSFVSPTSLPFAGVANSKNYVDAAEPVLSHTVAEVEISHRSSAASTISSLSNVTVTPSSVGTLTPGAGHSVPASPPTSVQHSPALQQDAFAPSESESEPIPSLTSSSASGLQSDELEEDVVAAGDTLFPKNLDLLTVETIRSSLERTKSLERRRSKRSNRSSRAENNVAVENEPTTVPNATEIHVGDVESLTDVSSLRNAPAPRSILKSPSLTSASIDDTITGVAAQEDSSANNTTTVHDRSDSLIDFNLESEGFSLDFDFETRRNDLVTSTPEIPAIEEEPEHKVDEPVVQVPVSVPEPVEEPTVQVTPASPMEVKQYQYEPTQYQQPRPHSSQRRHHHSKSTSRASSVDMNAAATAPGYHYHPLYKNRLSTMIPSQHSSHSSTASSSSFVSAHERQSSTTSTTAESYTGSRPKNTVTFSSRIVIYDTYDKSVYDRRAELATCNRLTPTLAQQIKEELNNFKMEMDIHAESRIYTHFF